MYGSFVDDWKTPDEYISRKVVMEMLENAQIISDGENCGYCTEDIDISSIPAADVAPVVHAEWVIDEFGRSCSACHEYIADDARTSEYCPSCGAKTDGGKEP